MTDPVLIVGAGPTGLTAALELSRMGVAVRLIDKRRLINVLHETAPRTKLAFNSKPDDSDAAALRWL